MSFDFKKITLLAVSSKRELAIGDFLLVTWICQEGAEKQLPQFC